jgi:hypothetical protein
VLHLQALPLLLLLLPLRLGAHEDATAGKHTRGINLQSLAALAAAAV